ncbi:hypothetical protein H1R20_g3387, partial [Candolleomyces eurysporus]
MESHIIDIDEDPALRPESKRKDHDPEPESKSSDLDFRPGSNIWSLYLEDAERAAKERVELMKSGLLDSVLLFAGLFAGVVSSFVIDARRDIQDDSEQNLLSDIRDALRGSPIEVVRIPISASWISALWLVSLYLTLFSAIMGILAKAWLANLIPTNTRRQASDAYNRYKLDTECTYYLQPAITFMFLLIQIASILFLVGLVIQSISDHQTLGHVLLGFCLSGGLIYLTMGCLPFVTSLSSFRTPLSDLLLFLKSIFHWKEGPNTAPSIGDINGCLGEIFVHLIKSPNPLRVDAAVAELSLLDFGEKWVQLICRSEAPERVLTCFRLHASTPVDDSYQQNETLSNYLLAFLRFAHQFEANMGRLTGKLGEINLKDYLTLLQALKTLLEPGHPLHRRNTLPETLHPLRLALRTEILCLFRQLPLEHSPSLHLMDFHLTEMDACPWNRVQGDIRSSHRLYVMLAACRGALQAQKNVMKVGALILGQSITQAGLTVLDMERTSEWAPDIAMNERQMIDAQGLDVLSRLFSAMVTIWEDMAVDAISNSPFLLRSAIRGACRPSNGILEALVLGFAPTGRAFRLHAIRMLNQVPELSADLFSSTSITTISNLIVYEDEDFREDGLQILVHLVTSSNEMMPLVTTALLASVRTGLYHNENEQILRTIAFVRTIWDGAWLATRFATEIKNAILKTLNTRWDSLRLHKHRHIVHELSELLEDDGSKDALEKPSYAFAWDHPSDLVVDIFPAVFERVVRNAINGSNFVVGIAIALLEKLSKDGRISGMLKVDALTWLETAAASRPSSWPIRHNTVLVLEVFIDQLDLTNKDLLKKLVEWAGTDQAKDVQCSSIRLITTICKNHSPSLDILETVELTILSVKDRVIKERDPTICSLWISLLSDMVKHVSFKIIPILLELYVKSDSDSEVWKDTHGDFLILGEHENDSEYIKALKSALPQNLKLPFHGSQSDWLPMVKWVRLLVALSQRSALKESVNKVLKGIANDMRDGIKANPTLKPVEPNSDTHECLQAHDNESAMDCMLQTTLKLPLRELLSTIGQDGQTAWVNTFTTIAVHFLLESHDAHTILFETARHSSEQEVQNACLKSLIQLTKQAVTRELITDTVNHFDDFNNNPEWGVRFSYMQLLSSVGALKDGNLLDEVLEKLSACALKDDNHHCRAEAINTILNPLETEDSNQDPSFRERYHKKVEAIVKAHFHEGINDESSKVRQSWIKLASTQVENDGFSGLTKLINTVIEDSDSGVRAEAITVIQQLLEDAEFQALPKLIEVVIKEGLNNTTFKSQDTLYSMFQNIELPEPIDSVLSKAIESALEPDAGSCIHSATIKLLGCLIGCIPGPTNANPDTKISWDRVVRVTSNIA